ncbi:GPI biosynthesis protein Pig-F [Kalmanozyma brasiliensis GHG001]|uniref:GPI biosynthesis protein Pig-F n=1 Tax=Kalmanozyma brasiliensis (strain GHG001) TaxID=1365824 RepID=UPI002867C9A1|nr:GPI biosynthesis protein Pig-F [Kalmanozyma brasiliensis GHG001]KAF6767436.1 GPI biosynthesis protein Pig-F [Kalmanozyma brasiliensis GHG001]
MPPKPRNTVPRPPPSSAPSAVTSSTTSNPPAPSSSVRRKRWIHAPATLLLLLLLHSGCHILAFILLTEPCLNPSYTTRLLDKVNYFTLLSTPNAIPRGEWGERFTRAGIRGLFGVGVVQVWFVARLNAYCQRAQREHGRIVDALKAQRSSGGRVGVDTRYEEQEGEVGNFIRQLESVSLTLLGLPLVVVGVGAMVGVMGAPLRGFVWQTGVLASQLTLLIALPLLHILGLPGMTTDNSSNNTTSPSASTIPETGSTTSLRNTPTHWTALLTLKPNPTFLLPLYHPLIGCVLGTVASSALLALDWDVAWQTYPFPLLVGSLAGVVLGDVWTIGIVLFG